MICLRNSSHVDLDLFLEVFFFFFAFLTSTKESVKGSN